MKKLDHTSESDYLFQNYGDINRLYMYTIKYDESSYFKVINRKGVVNVYLLEAGDDAEKLKNKLKEIRNKLKKAII